MKAITGLKIAGMVLIGLMALVYLAFGIGESAGGDLGGLMHLVQLVAVGLALWLYWKRPLWRGILMLTISLL